MKDYELIFINKSKYMALVLSKSFYSPISMRNEIAKELSGKKGYILFDLLLLNGQSSNRFIEAFFNGNTFLFDSFKRVNKIPNDLLDISFRYYHKNQDLFNVSSLTNVERFCFLKGIQSKRY